MKGFKQNSSVLHRASVCVCVCVCMFVLLCAVTPTKLPGVQTSKLARSIPTVVIVLPDPFQGMVA